MLPQFGPRESSGVRSLSTSAIIFFASFLLIGSPASAELKPEEVAIIAMADSKESQHIAEYYAKARGIPTTHIILLEGKPELRVARSKWERKIRPAILIELEKRKLIDKVRCLVTCWDVPLVIGRLSGSYPGLAERKYALEKERADLVDRFDNLIYAMDSFGSKEPPRKKPPLLSDTKLEQLQKAFNTAIIDLQQRIKESGTEDDKKRVRTILQQMFIAANGSDGMVRMMSPRSESTELSPEKKTQRAPSHRQNPDIAASHHRDGTVARLRIARPAHFRFRSNQVGLVRRGPLDRPANVSYYKK